MLRPDGDAGVVSVAGDEETGEFRGARRVVPNVSRTNVEEGDGEWLQGRGPRWGNPWRNVKILSLLARVFASPAFPYPALLSWGGPTRQAG